MDSVVNWLRGLKEAFQSSFSSPKRIIILVLMSGFVFSVIALLSFPAYSTQMINAGPVYWLTAVTSLTSNIYMSSGAPGFLLTLLFSVFTAVALFNSYISYKSASLQGESLAGLIPGIAASGCASCGVGLLSVVGLTGGLAVLPFEGNLLRFGGIMLIAFFLGRNGDPEKCKV